MNFDNIMNRKVGMNILFWVLIVFMLFSVNQCNRNSQLKREISKIRKELKKDYEERIKQREKNIADLEKENAKSRKEIQVINQKLDSLQKVKNKVQIKYVDSKQKIKVMDSHKIKQYWDEELN